MNSPNNPIELNEYAHEPATSRPGAAGSPSATSPSPYVSASPSTLRRARTLKARIKRNMLNDSFTSSITSVASAPVERELSPPSEGGSNNGRRRDTREESIFEAASALASLGIMSPNSSLNAGTLNAGGGGEMRHAMAHSDGSVTFGPRRPGVGGGGYASAPAAAMTNVSTSAAVTAEVRNELDSLKERQKKEVDYLMAQQRRRHRDVLSMVRPPPSLGGGLLRSAGNVGYPNPNNSSTVSSTSSDLMKGLAGAGGFGGPSSLMLQQQNAKTQHSLQPPHEVGASRPFAGLLGSDIPLTFPQKLMEVLSNPEVAHIITWLPHGKGFMILQKRKFAIDVMPLYFKHSKFTSFTRKLNRWGFTRVSRGPEMGAYYHKYFQRGNYLLCMQMHCQSHNKPSSSAPGSTKDTAAKEKDAAGAAKEGVGAPPSSPAESTPMVMPKTSKSPEAESCGDSHMDHHMGDDSPPVPQVPSLPQPGPVAAPQNDEIPVVGNVGSSAFSTYAMFEEPKQKTQHGGTLARLYAHHNHHPHRHNNSQHQNQQQHQRQEGSATSSMAFDQTFSRQHQILQGGQGQQVLQGGQGQHGQVRQDNQKPWLQHRLVRDADGRGTQDQRSPQLQSFSMQQPSSTTTVVQPIPTTFRSCMKQSPQQQQPMSQQRLDGPSPMQLSSQQSNLNQQQAASIDRLLGVNTTSSRNHPLVIANALDALKSCNEEAYLTALMNKEHDTKAKNLTTNTTTPPLTTYQVQSRVHAAMEAQLRQLKEYNQERQRIADTSMSSNSRSPQETAANSAHHNHALMLEKMKQLDKMSRANIAPTGNAGMRTSAGLGSVGLKGTMQHPAKPHNVKDVMQQSTYGTVARLYNEINAMNQQQQGGGSGTAGNPNSQQGLGVAQRKFHRPVRRASAA